MVEEGFLYMWKVLNVTMLQSYNVTKLQCYKMRSPLCF